MDGRVCKATLTRGTLHLISARDFDRYRVACRHRNALLARALRQMAEAGADAGLLREEILALLRERPRTRAELLGALTHRIPDEMSPWLTFGVLHLTGATMNVPEDARFDHHAGSRYRLAPPPVADPDTALRCVLTAYLGAFGPASRADIAEWLGQPIGVFGPALAQLDVRSRSGPRTGARSSTCPTRPGPVPDVSAQVRFLPKWDYLLLAYERRERILPEHLRRTVIGKNGDVVLATFLVDGWSPALGRPRGEARRP